VTIWLPEAYCDVTDSGGGAEEKDEADEDARGYRFRDRPPEGTLELDVQFGEKPCSRRATAAACHR